MKRKILSFIAFIGLISLLFSCEKDETRAVLSADPIAPTLVTLPDLTLKRANGTDILTFVGTPVDPGFVASATYFLEVCESGNNFVETVVLYSGIQDTLIQIKESALNDKFLMKFPADKTSAVDFRIRAVLSVDAGQGALPMVYSSEPTTENVATYGPPTLFVTGDTYGHGIVSPDNDGKYSGWIYSTGTAFTFTNGDDGKVYGATGADVVLNGTAITLASGFYKASVNLNTMKFESSKEDWGIIGSAIPPYDWSVDVNMTYRPEIKKWEVTGNFKTGEFKFRANDNWDNNFGDSGANGTLDAGGTNIKLAADGNYTIRLDLARNTYNVVKN